MPNPRLILVTGATGAVGPRVVEALCATGYRVRTLALDPPPVHIWPTDVETVMGDVTDPVIVQTAMKGVDAVIHLAALLHVVNPPPAMKVNYERINVGGTAAVVEAAIQNGVKRVLLASTISVYGPAGGRVLDESAATVPDTLYGQTKLDAERIVLKARNQEGQPLGTILRFGAVYGPRIKGNYQRLLRSLARGHFVPIGNGANRRTLVYDRDVAQAAVLAMQHPWAAGNVFNVANGQCPTMNEIIAAMCAALGRPRPRLSLPVGPLRFAAGILEDGARLAGLTSPVVRATIDKYTEDIAVSSQRLQTQLGFVPRYDLASGWRETVGEMRQMGEL